MKKLNRNQQSVIPRLLENSARGGAWMRMFFMLVIMMMTSAFATAQETYGIKVAGEYVTSDNYLDLTEISGVSGKVYFDPNTRTLMLDNATIEADGSNAILNQDCKYLVIELIGTNTINVTGSAGIYLQEETSILGTSSSKLTITSDKGAVLFENSPLEINNCWLEVEGKWGISAVANVAEEVLTIRNSHVEATGSTGSICDIANLVLDNCSITQPVGAKFDARNNAVVLNGEMVTDKIVIKPDSYGIKIAGVDVTSLNSKDLSVIDGVDGKMSYNPETKTLTMKDVTINITGENVGIWNKEVKGLKINLVGNNTITANQAGITIGQPSTISGSGTLRLKSSDNCGIYLPSSLAVEGIKLYAEGKWGIAGQVFQKSGNVLTICNAYVEVTGSKGSVGDLENLILDGCSITQPNGAEFDAQYHSVLLNGEVVTDKVVIEPDSYGFKIAGVDVTALNCKDLSVIDGVDGKMSYDPETKTLTMEDVTINGADINGIVNRSVEGMKIKLVGNNTITTNNACITINETSTISGSGTLRLKSSSDCGLFMKSSSLTVESVKLYAEGIYGVAGFDGVSGEILTLRNAYVEATGGYGSICDLQNLILDGCAITQPTGAAFDANVHAVALNGEKVTDKVVIGSVTNGISDITTDVPAHAKGIYSVTGVKQTQQWNELPAGIYIVDGVKRVKK
uniref:hypothetical protein n=1 Tax=Prevotella sp. TaxID=59823 RepID=UPI00402975BA